MVGVVFGLGIVVLDVICAWMFDDEDKGRDTTPVLIRGTLLNTLLSLENMVDAAGMEGYGCDYGKF